MPIAPNFSSVFSKNWEINFTQCMPNGYLKYPELCNILQLTAAAHSEMGGISFTDMQAFNQAWVLSRIRVEIAKLPKWKDVITVNTWIITFENSRSIRAFEVLLNGEKIIGSETFWVVFNTEKRRLEALALPYNHFELFPNKRATEISFSKVELHEDKEIVFEKIVCLSDLDNVNHVNNVKYLEWCLDLTDVDLVLNQNIESFDMNFIRELSIKEEIRIYQTSIEKLTVFHITKEDKSCFALQLNLK